MVGAVEGPPVVPAEQEGDIGTGGRPGDLLECRELGPEPDGLAPAARLGPPWGSIALWNFSAAARAARHWKNMTPSEPRASA